VETETWLVLEVRKVSVRLLILPKPSALASEFSRRLPGTRPAVNWLARSLDAGRPVANHLLILDSTTVAVNSFSKNRARDVSKGEENGQRRWLGFS